MNKKTLLVGELNPYGSDPGFALYPFPEYASGARLCQLIIQVPRRLYMKHFDRANLCNGKWSIREARAQVNRLLKRQPKKIVLLGSKVCSAFGLTFIPFKQQKYITPELKSSVDVVILPHPSGLCRIWNEPNAFERANAALQKAGIIEKICIPITTDEELDK